jgi:hypothetical protein
MLGPAWARTTSTPTVTSAGLRLRRLPTRPARARDRPAHRPPRRRPRLGPGLHPLGRGAEFLLAAPAPAVAHPLRGRADLHPRQRHRLDQAATSATRHPQDLSVHRHPELLITSGSVGQRSKVEVWRAALVMAARSSSQPPATPTTGSLPMVRVRKLPRGRCSRRFCTPRKVRARRHKVPAAC